MELQSSEREVPYLVTAEELEQLLQAHGWYLDFIQKRGQGKRFAYAKQRQGRRVVTRYLKAESKLDELTEDYVLKRISS